LDRLLVALLERKAIPGGMMQFFTRSMFVPFMTAMGMGLGISMGSPKNWII
jgi:hypothetical protein